MRYLYHNSWLVVMCYIGKIDFDNVNVYRLFGCVIILEKSREGLYVMRSINKT
jgi:hypothetical protein